jgi:hypothetical protein
MINDAEHFEQFMDAVHSLGSLNTEGQTVIDLTNLYVELACDADLMRQLTETHPVKQALRSYERIYLGRTEG